MARAGRITLCALLLSVSLAGAALPARAEPTTSTPAPQVQTPQPKPEPEPVDLTPRLQEIYEARARWLLTNSEHKPIEPDYTDSKTAKWALQHELGKFRYMSQWAKNRDVTFVEAVPTLRAKLLKSTPTSARFYVEQGLQLGYTYANEPEVNRFGVGTRHILDLRKQGDRWLINLEWYTDPLGDDTEVPDVTPALVPADLPGAVPVAAPVRAKAERRVAGRGFNREGAVTYADTYCGAAWGCGNNNRYNPKYRDFNGVGGDCTNFISQALRDGGGLNNPIITRVSNLAGHVQYSGQGAVIAKDAFQNLWKRASQYPDRFQSLLKWGDLVAYQEKGKLEHFGIITGFDSHGYALIDSHTADRYHVPFDLGWDRKTVYWMFKMRE